MLNSERNNKNLEFRNKFANLFNRQRVSMYLTSRRALKPVLWSSVIEHQNLKSAIKNIKELGYYMILGANGDCTCGSCDLSIVNKQDIDLKYYARKEGEVIAVLALNCLF